MPTVICQDKEPYTLHVLQPGPASIVKEFHMGERIRFCTYLKKNEKSHTARFTLYYCHHPDMELLEAIDRTLFGGDILIPFLKQDKVEYKDLGNWKIARMFSLKEPTRNKKSCNLSFTARGSIFLMTAKQLIILSNFDQDLFVTHLLPQRKKLKDPSSVMEILSRFVLAQLKDVSDIDASDIDFSKIDVKKLLK
ncbi:hypothetical protein NCAS_0A06480 [Naumovozyma castellii]|uniref:Uncharacterized protein n=1 Tax=Naumovozyma castellii TaxID=27288 RepID=G0V6W0_NAUCA|nr:hypothetical protein NCAS_0A06480 [Naumovozyma castellii CBS 4309]CCC67206.1 hypothetical protein NCAS_0A06480 [Naumovozyma castellii CBS 4309]